MKKNSILHPIWKALPLEVKRLINSYKHNKEAFLLKSSPHVFKEIYHTNLWNSDESKSGEGSTLEATVTIRKHIPLIIEKYGIKTMLDSPCGDFNWMKEVPLSCNYLGGDIVNDIVEVNQRLYAGPKVNFQRIDLSKDALPKVDLIFCKDCLQHLSDATVKLVLNNFKKSGSKYLLVTSYPKTWRNYDIYDGDYRPLNLMIAPYNFRNPLMNVHEISTQITVEPDKTMYLFEIDKLPEF